MDLKTRIAAEIVRGGPIPFEQFMQAALYDSDHGYYSSGVARIGPTGDFTTSPHVSNAFGGCLANLAAMADQALGNPTPFHLIEGGPGEGRLAKVMLDALAENHKGLYARLVYSADEQSPALAARQRLELADHSRVIGELPDRDAIGIYLSNEVADALPVGVIEISPTTVMELRVDHASGNFRFVPSEIKNNLLLELIRETMENPVLTEERAYGATFRIEVSPRLGDWLCKASSRFLRGYIVTIDYGDVEEKLYGTTKPLGTLRGYKEGHFVEDVLFEPGTCDLTASVNFSAFLRRAHECGLESSRVLKQWELLSSLGIESVVEKMADNCPDELSVLALRQELWPLLFPGAGMGETFKAVIAAKGVELETLGLGLGLRP